MSQEKHTSPPWKVSSNDAYKVVTSSVTIATCSAEPGNPIENAERIVAAVNACQDIPLVALEDGIVAEMVEALEGAAKIIKTARNYFPKSMQNSDRFSLENTNARIVSAIEKMKPSKVAWSQDQEQEAEDDQ